MSFRELWREVFGDSKEEIDRFVNNHYHPENLLTIEDDNGACIAMCHLLEFESSIGRVGYLYALACDPKYRAHGYGKELTKRAIELSGKRGFTALLLIPAEEWLKEYYSKLGFEPFVHLKFSTPDNYDFGTGDSSLDVAMIYHLPGSASGGRGAPRGEKRDALHLFGVAFWTF